MTLGLVTAGLTLPPTLASAQVGQTAMAPAGGVVGRAVAGLQQLNQDGPGILYYGVNAADRGLGYVGSYMTLGGYIPGYEDDLGGLWAADLRGHLSQFGGFFSNLGLVRKQFLGGTLLGVGVYWDYDGDLDQYPAVVIPGAFSDTVFPGGQVYNQVGVSGEWLTDLGNLRTNGYIPVGSTGQTVGPFVGNSILCVNGINAALGGADLEVGAYIPGLSDWAGMVSVGGYALGNTRYEFPGGQTAVPWFGGVYTRLDMTFIENWDFSLQANNDSYFDWTGFARLTYRMGGSRRRNVPDQVEQPLMRNEHIVRVHQAPVVATNPNNLDAAGNALPWQVFHVDNAAAPGGNGTAESPYQTLAAAQAAAVATWDIVYLHVGNSRTNPYVTPLGGYSFGNENQYLIGEGSQLRIPTVSCGPRSLQSTNNTRLYPLITNPVGPAINVDQPGARVDHVEIVNSNVGIADGAGFAAPGVAFVSDVIIRGSGGPFQRGVEIASSTGEFRFDNVRLSNLGNDGFVVSAPDGDVVVTNSSLTDISGTGVLASGDTAGIVVADTRLTRIDGVAVAATGPNATVNVRESRIADTQGAIGDAIVASGVDSTVNLTDTVVTGTTGSGLVASGIGADIVATRSRIIGTGDPGIAIPGDTATVLLDASTVSGVAGTGVVVTGTAAVFQMQNAAQLTDVDANGIELLDPDSIAYVLDRSLITRIAQDGILSAGASLLLQDASIQTVGGAGINATGVNGTKVVHVQGGSISNAVDGGILVANSNLRVERLDPADPRTRQTTIANTGVFGVSATTNTFVNSRVLVEDANITGTLVGISIRADADPLGLTVPVIQFNGQGNRIAATNNGTGIQLSAVFDPGGLVPLSRVNAAVFDNAITVGTDGEGILLTTVGGPTQFPDPVTGQPIQVPAANRPLRVAAGGAVNLSNLNNGATVFENPPQALPAIFSSVNYNPATFPPLPPPPPPLTPPPIP